MTCKVKKWNWKSSSLVKINNYFQKTYESFVTNCNNDHYHKPQRNS